MHTHILGICGTFMGGIAILAKQLGYSVSGSDQNVYPPMSTQLNSLGIPCTQGFEADQLNKDMDCVVIGNVMKRGLPVIEALLEQDKPLISGPEWLAEHVLRHRHVLAVSGTHGKTTTSSMLAWILEYAGLKPGFLIGGIPNNFGVSARLGEGKYFVVEADEYDSAFFDKRSKFVHYRPRTLIINNLEFDHADIFQNLKAIQVQFHHMIRTIPQSGLIIYPAETPSVTEVLQMGCWSHASSFHETNPTGWHVLNPTPSGDTFQVAFQDKILGTVKWNLIGQHNMLNALAAIAAAEHVDISPLQAIEALSQFQSVKRRLEIKGQRDGITVFDDFAHHPTAIATTLAGLRAKVGDKTNIIAVLDIRSNTMRAGHHQTELSASLDKANQVFLFKSPEIQWDVEQVWKLTQKPGGVFSDHHLLLASLQAEVKSGDQVVFMSNGGFNGVQNKFLNLLLEPSV